MWSRRLLAGAALVLGLGLAAGPALAANPTDTSSPGRATVTVKIDVIGGEPSIAKAWKKGIEKYWNNGPGLGRFEYCGRKVEFVADIQAIARGQAGRPDAHKIRMKLLPPKVYKTSSVRTLDPFDPAKNTTGDWDNNDDDQTVAHEFGHLLGLHDEYVWVHKDGNGRRPDTRDPGEYSEPKAEFRGQGSLMAERGKILQRHIDQAMRNHGVPGCKELWEGSMNASTATSWGCTDGWQFKFNLEIRPDGRVEGQGSARLTSGPRCRYALTQPSWRTLQYDVFGKRSGVRLRLRFRRTAWDDGVNWGGIEAIYDPANPDGGPPVELALAGRSASGEGSWRLSMPPNSVTANGIVTARCIENCSAGSR